MKKKSAARKAKITTQALDPFIQISEPVYWVCAIAIVGLIAFLCFWELGALPALDWDESRHGVSAYEMMKSGNYIVNTYQYEPDYWNLKPPMSFWGIIAGYKLFGFNLLGMRFYSAAAFLLTAGIIGAFCKKRYGNLESLVVLLLVAANSQFYRFHYARNADADALFGLFTVISILAMIQMEEKPWMSMVCSGAFAMAFLTKSWHALFLIAVVGTYMLWSKMLFRLTPKQWVGFLAAGALPILLWGVLRFQYDGTRFLAEMIQVDLLKRSVNVVENHAGPFAFYFILLFRDSPVTGLLPVITALLFFWYLCSETSKVKYLTVPPRFTADMPAYLLWILLPLMLFSVVATKLQWYSIPIQFPILMVTGLILAQVLRCPIGSLVIQKGVAIGISIVLLISGARDCWTQINTPKSDQLGLALHLEQPALAGTKGERAWFAVADDAPFNWSRGSQKYVLTGELYFDWDCQIGTVQDFLDDPEAQILVTWEDPYREYQHQLDAACTPLVSYNFCMVFRKNAV